MARREPERTCVVCRSRQGKRALLRVARLADGRVAVDMTGKGPGRGAYVCPRPECWREPELSRRLARALKVTLNAEDQARLALVAAGLEPTTEHG